jgi:sterol desaturase/sphingolipid hydroxylase (fatty acid hydroxylase superfamily)
MDYTMYAWHVATHKIPRLWRFHRIHHLDRDMDTTTALRFHLGEMLWSVPWRLAQVVVSGADEGVYRHWQRALALCILFQHSNWRLPVRVDRGLARWIITPRLHGVHHGRDDQDVNWGSTLAIWDLLHHTWRWKASAQPVGLDGEPDLPVPALLEAPWA